MLRAILIVAALLGIASTACAQRAMQGEIRSNGDLWLTPSLKLGRSVGGKLLLQPESVSGDASQATVTPNALGSDNTLARLIAGRAAIDASGNIGAVRGLRADSDGTNAFSVKPFWAFFPSNDFTRYANAFKLTTKLDGEAWESGTGSDCEIKTGYNRVFAAGLSVAVGDNIVATPPGATEGFTYRVTQGGLLGLNLTGWPTSVTQTAEFISGTARLRIINFSNLSAKICNTSTIFMQDGAGLTWGRNENFNMRPQTRQPRFVTGIEQDFVNESGWDCNLFSGNTCNAYNMFLEGHNRSTIGLNIARNGAGPAYSVEWALSLQGQFLARDAAIEINTGGRVGIGIGRYSNVLGRSVYENASLLDEAQAPRAISLGGLYGEAALSTLDATITPQGGFPTAFAMASGQQVCWAGFNVCWRFDTASNRMKLRWSGQDVLSVDGNGALIAKGGVTTGTP